MALATAISGFTFGGGGGAPSTAKPSIAPRPLSGSTLVAATAADAGQGAQALLELGDANPGGRILPVFLALQRHAKRQRLFGLEAGIDARQLDEAPDEQPGADEQHDGERHLRHDERRPHALAAAAGAAAGGRRATRSGRRVPVNCSAGRTPKARLVASAIAKVNETTAPFTPTSSRRGMSAGCAATSARVREVRDREPGRGAGRTEDDRFGEELAQQADPAGAERRAHGQLRLARRRAREQQVGDVGARHEQHEPDGAEQDQERRPHVAEHHVGERSRR